jgi:UDP-glucose 4-epimerase
VKIIVTGGAGYIGSHTVVSLLSRGDEVVIVDNLVNANPNVLERIERITGKIPTFYDYDVCDERSLDEVFDAHKPDSVIHFAGLKAVGESVENPILYYDNNLRSTLALLRTMDRHSVKSLVFSSSATVYGDPVRLPLTEDMPLSATNPYGQTKLVIERILMDVARTGGWHIVSLRYFNPVGAHESGLIGEDPSGIPNNLLPYITQVAVGKRDRLSVFGGDYETVDGTGVRDYIHVLDLAEAHLAALDHLADSDEYRAVNVGTGKGISVLQLIDAFQAASGKTIPYDIVTRRPGDVASCYADVARAEREFGWKARRSIDQACEDSWRWQSLNPDGYAS